MKIDSLGRFVKVPLKDRFWDKVDKNGPLHPTDKSLGQCWIWTGARITDKDKPRHRYGLIWNDTHTKRLHAHRVAWALTNGPIPKGKHILHSCDNPPCVNPKHVRPGTDADNHRDMVIRGRSCVGEKNGGARLTEKAVIDIRRRYPKATRTGIRPPKERAIIVSLCKRHGISFNLASRIARRERWKHIP